MSDASITVRPARDEEFARVEALLEANDLPCADVRSKPECFYVARSDGEFVGVGGIERYSPDGLLRSIVVRESYRGRGYGTALCDALEDRARTAGVETLYLLTTTAAGFFRRRGYDESDHAEVPPRVRGSTEFADLCPASATCMVKPLR